jgi:hypothetical protein
MALVRDPWASGLFQLRRPADGGDCAVGYATLARDALGQPLARLILWTPEGTGSDGYFWAGDTYLLGNLIDATVEIVLDWRLETGEIGREESFPLAARETDEILYVPAEYDDDEFSPRLRMRSGRRGRWSRWKMRHWSSSGLARWRTIRSRSDPRTCTGGAGRHNQARHLCWHRTPSHYLHNERLGLS